MAISTKLNLLFFPPKTPPPTPRTLPPQLPLIHSKGPTTLRLKSQFTIPVLQPKLGLKTSIEEEERENPHHEHYSDYSDCLSVTFPSLAFSNILFFNGTYNFQLAVGEKEPEEALISRFRRESFRTRVLQECKRRKYFENTREKKKRKTRDAQRRNRRRRPQPKVSVQAEVDSSKKKKGYSEGDDNWEALDIDLPYC